jgi:hypothetical protein
MPDNTETPVRLVVRASICGPAISLVRVTDNRTETMNFASSDGAKAWAEKHGRTIVNPSEFDGESHAR